MHVSLEDGAVQSACSSVVWEAGNSWFCRGVCTRTGAQLFTFFQSYKWLSKPESCMLTHTHAHILISSILGVSEHLKSEACDVEHLQAWQKQKKWLISLHLFSPVGTFCQSRRTQGGNIMANSLNSRQPWGRMHRQAVLRCDVRGQSRADKSWGFAATWSSVQTTEEAFILLSTERNT